MESKFVKEDQGDRNQGHRLFGLTEAPVYKPSEAEFEDPLVYIRQISEEASQYGICKIVPPRSWTPPFAINPALFRFKTRKQELNSVEGATRVSLNYIDQLARFHRQFGVKINKFPNVDRRPLDLYKLKSAVQRRGGFEEVCRTKKWAEIGRDLGYSGKIMSSLSTSLKNTFQRWLLPYEDYLRHCREAKSRRNAAIGVTRPETDSMTALSGTVIENDLSTPEPDGSMELGLLGISLSVGSPQIELDNHGQEDYRGSSNHCDRNYKSRTTLSPSRQSRQTLDPGPFRKTLERCQISSDEGCHSPSRNRKRRHEELSATLGASAEFQKHQVVPSRTPSTADQMLCCMCMHRSSHEVDLQCSGCGARAHFRCIPQGLDQGASIGLKQANLFGRWLCHQCLIGDTEFGFEEGSSYSLEEFKAKADVFKHSYLAKKLPHSLDSFPELTGEVQIEQEFWRLVENLTESVVVEYGADIHSTIHGSGFPDLERMPAEPYAAHPWNLNNLPCNPSSLSRFIDSDISGMTVPWLYVGMCFSTFCWHNEDHYMFSANYHHQGDTKTWYGIPADDAEKFEEAMKEALPDLFRNQPDLLCQLVTLITPERLLKAGIRVYGLDQREREFVITFPQAYHAGFNHGFNVNEAVNFAPYEWEPFGASSVQRLSQYHHQPCFSHDELLFKFAGSEFSCEAAEWLGRALKSAWARELNLRRELRDRLSDLTIDSLSDLEVLDISTLSKTRACMAREASKEHICEICHSFCFFSFFRCSRSGKQLCLTHASLRNCCGTESPTLSKQNTDHTLQYCISDSEIRDLIANVEQRGYGSERWQATMCRRLGNSHKITAPSLSALTDQLNFASLESAPTGALQKYVQKCRDWAVEAQLPYKSRVRRSAESRASSAPISSSTSDFYIQTSVTRREIEATQQLVLGAHLLAFESVESRDLQARLDVLLKEQARDDRDAQRTQRPVPQALSSTITLHTDC